MRLSCSSEREIIQYACFFAITGNGRIDAKTQQNPRLTVAAGANNAHCRFVGLYHGFVLAKHQWKLIFSRRRVDRKLSTEPVLQINIFHWKAERWKLAAGNSTSDWWSRTEITKMRGPLIITIIPLFFPICFGQRERLGNGFRDYIFPLVQCRKRLLTTIRY